MKIGVGGSSDLSDGPDPRREGRAFERICRWYLLNTPEYRGRMTDAWWDDWPDVRGRDAGIDLVAQEASGGVWAAQAKLYSREYAIKKADVEFVPERVGSR